jgi:hypothetical protein
MPLLDHFRPPIHPGHPWESFRSNWATRIADSLNALLPPPYYAEESTYAGGLMEFDVAIFRASGNAVESGSSGRSATRPPPWTPPHEAIRASVAYPDAVDGNHPDAVRRPVGVVQFVSTGNVDREGTRRTFLAKCTGILRGGTTLVLVNVVATRRQNLHRQLLHRLSAGAAAGEYTRNWLSASSYAPVPRSRRPKIDVWCEPLVLGRPLPTIPLRVGRDEYVPVDLEATYREACRRRRLPSECLR